MSEVRCPNPPGHDGWLDCPAHQSRPPAPGASSTVHYGANNHGECGAHTGLLTLLVREVTCRTCRGWLPIVAPPDDVARPAPPWSLSPMGRLAAHALKDIHDWQDDRVAGHVLCTVCGVSRHDWLNMRESRAKLEALPQSLMTELERQQADEIERLRAFGQDMAHRAGREEDRAAQLTREIEQLRAQLAHDAAAAP